MAGVASFNIGNFKEHYRLMKGMGVSAHYFAKNLKEAIKKAEDSQAYKNLELMEAAITAMNTKGLAGFNARLALTVERTNRLSKLFNTISDTIRIIKMSDFSKIASTPLIKALSGLKSIGLGGLDIGKDIAGSYVDLVEDKLKLHRQARAWGTNAKSLQAFEFASKQIGADDILGSSYVGDIRDAIAELSNTGEAAIMGFDLQALEKMDGVESVIALLKKYQEIAKSGDVKALNNEFLKGSRLMELMGLGINDTYSLDLGKLEEYFRYAKDTNSLDIGAQTTGARAINDLEWIWDNFKQAILQQFTPAIVNLTPKLKELGDRLSKWIGNTGIVQKISDKLSKWVDGNFNIEKVIDIFTTTLPDALMSLTSAIIDIVEIFAVGKTDDKLKALREKIDKYQEAFRKSDEYKLARLRSLASEEEYLASVKLSSHSAAVTSNARRANINAKRLTEGFGLSQEETTQMMRNLENTYLSNINSRELNFKINSIGNNHFTLDVYNQENEKLNTSPLAQFTAKSMSQRNIK